MKKLVKSIILLILFSLLVFQTLKNMDVFPNKLERHLKGIQYGGLIVSIGVEKQTEYIIVKSNEINIKVFLPSMSEFKIDRSNVGHKVLKKKGSYKVVLFDGESVRHELFYPRSKLFYSHDYSLYNYKE